MLEDFGADIAVESFYSDVVDESHVLLQVALLSTDFRTKLTLEGLYVTETVNSSLVLVEVVPCCKLSATNVTRVFRARMDRPRRRRRSDVILNVRRVLVGAER